MQGYNIMTLNRINDFRVQPNWYEYVFLYSVTAVSSIILSLSLLDKISGLYGWLALILILSVTYIYSVIKRTRDIRAKQFFCDVIAQYTLPELQRILPRYQNTDIEHALIVNRLHYLQNNITTESNSLNSVIAWPLS